MKLKSLVEGIQDKWTFKAVILIGGPGSGKNFFQKKLLHTFRNLDPDIIRNFLFKKKKIPLDTRKHTEQQRKERFDVIEKKAYEKTAKIEKNVLAGRLPVVMNRTGRNFNVTKNMKNQLESLGYEVKMIYVKTTPEKAQERNIARERKLDPEFVKSIRKGVDANVEKFKALFGGNFYIVNNTDPYEKSKPEWDRLWMKIAKWMDRQVTNNAAKKWRKEQEIKKIT